MNRNVFASALSVLMLGGAAAVAQDAMQKTEEKSAATAEGTKTSKHTVVGTVKKYEAGKTLKVVVGKKMLSYTLDSKMIEATVDPAVAVGSKVKIIESKNAEGVRTLTVNPAS